MPRRYSMRVVMVAAPLLLSPAARAASEPDPDAPASPSPATCGEESRQEQPPWGRLYVSRFYPRQTFAARSAPTELLQVAELQLLKQGYVAIGWIEVTQFKLLHPAGQPDEPIAGPEGARAVALAAAGQLGGEAFTLFGKEEPATEWATGSTPGATRTGTTVRGTVWRRAPSQSRAQLLVYAAQKGQRDTVERLLSTRVPVDSREPRFCHTPLIAAASAGHSEVVRVLLAAGASRELTDSYGVTALGYAAFPRGNRQKSCECAQLLRQAGAKEPAQPFGQVSFDFPAPRRCPR